MDDHCEQLFTQIYKFCRFLIENCVRSFELFFRAESNRYLNDKIHSSESYNFYQMVKVPQ